MEKTRENEIINSLWQYSGGFISETRLNQIVNDKAEEHFAVARLRGMGISLCHEHRTLAYGEKQIANFRHRKDIERELTIQRKHERQRKELLRDV